MGLQLLHWLIVSVLFSGFFLGTLSLLAFVSGHGGFFFSFLFSDSFLGTLSLLAFAVGHGGFQDFQISVKIIML